MQKLNFFSCALLIIPLTFATRANAKVDTGDLYPTPIGWQIDEETRSEISGAHLPGQAITIVKRLLAGEERTLSKIQVHPSLAQFPKATHMLRKILVSDKFLSGFNAADILLLSQFKTKPAASEKRIFAKQKTEPEKDKKITERFAKKPKPGVHSGHFYKPFLERPEMFY